MTVSGRLADGNIVNVQDVRSMLRIDLSLDAVIFTISTPAITRKQDQHHPDDLPTRSSQSEVRSCSCWRTLVMLLLFSLWAPVALLEVPSFCTWGPQGQYYETDATTIERKTSIELE